MYIVLHFTPADGTAIRQCSSGSGSTLLVYIVLHFTPADGTALDSVSLRVCLLNQPMLAVLEAG